MAAVRFLVLSDLHIDSYARRGFPVGQIPEVDCDAIIVAGDTANNTVGVEWLIVEAERLQKPLFVITGNHDYFGADIAAQDAILRRLTAGTQVTFLQCDAVDIAGVRLLGTTLWTDYTYNAQPDTLAMAAHTMRDYREIIAYGRAFTPADSVALHLQQRAWLKDALQKAAAEGVPSVAITHHSVSPRSVSEQYKDFASNAGFVTDLSAWMTADFAPKLWVHGHTHEAFDYQQGRTRVVVNPRGYPTEVSSTGLLFDWAKVVSVEA